MKTLLLLGGYGFLGSNLLDYIDRFKLDDYRVIVFDKFPKHPHSLRFKCVQKTYSGDFSNENHIEQIFKEQKIDMVFHLLSSTVPVTSDNAIYDIESNLVPTLRLLNIMERHDVKDILYLSSGGAVYGDFIQKVHNESDAVYPKSSYGIVKLAIEKYLLSYAENNGFKTLILRLSNPFGKFHYNPKQGIINIALRKALSNEQFQIWGSGNGKKDYIFVDDFCRIVFQLTERGISTDVLNVGAGHAYSVNEITGIIKKLIPRFEFTHVEASKSDVQHFQLDTTKLNHRLGEFVYTPFSEALKQTLEWEKNQYSN